MIRRLIVLLVLAAAIVPTDLARAQGVLPAPSAEERIACGKGLAPLYGDVTTKRWLIQHGTGRSPSETCKLMDQYSQAELKTNSAKCGVTSDSISRMKSDHEKTQAFRNRVCTYAKWWPEEYPVVSDFGDPAYERLGRELGK